MLYPEDPRLLAVKRRLASVKNVLLVMSSKGGVGKTLVSTVLALKAAHRGFKAGLFDLDLTNPGCHVVLGLNPVAVKPKEEKGIIPLRIRGIAFMTAAFYSEDRPLPLRGAEIDDAVKELLAITVWGSLDLLVVDTPSGMSDEVLDALSYMGNTKPLVVATPSPLALKSVERLLRMLVDAGEDVVGLVENMSDKPSRDVKLLCDRFGVEHLGSIPFDGKIDRAMGDLDILMASRFSIALEGVMDRLAVKTGLARRLC